MDKEIKLSFKVDTSNVTSGFSQIKKMTSELNKELSSLGKNMKFSELDNVSKGLKNTQSEAKKVETILNNANKALEKTSKIDTTKSVKQLKSELDAANQQVTQLSSKLKSSVNSFDIKTDSADDIKKLTTELNSASKKSKDLETAYKKAMNTVEKESNSASSSLSKSFNNAFTKIGRGINFLIFSYMGRQIVDGLAYIFTISSDMAETENLFAVSLGNMSEEAEAFAERLNNAWGVSTTVVKQYVAQLNNMYKSMGIAEDTSYEMATAITELSYNISSLYNISVDDALEKFKSATLGISRPMKELGIVTNVAQLQQTALKYGIISTNREMTSQEKALATVWAVWEQTESSWASGTVTINGVTKTIGDMSKTLYGNANMVRVMKDQLGDMARYWGLAFQPIVNVVLPWLIALNSIIIDLGKTFATFIGGFFGFDGIDDMLASFGSIGTIMSESDASALESLEDIDSGVSDIGNSADSTADKLASLTGSIDELNVLNADTTSTSGVSGGSSGLSNGYIENDIGLPTIDTIDDTAFDTIKGLVNEILSLFDGLKTIDFNPLISSIVNLFNSLVPYFSMTWDIFSFIIESVLIPLGKVVIESALPGFLDFVSISLQYLYIAIEPLMNVGMWLIETFLIPLAKISLKSFGDTLQYISDLFLYFKKAIDENKTVQAIIKGITEAFETFGNWIEENQFISGVIEALAVALGIFVAVVGVWIVIGTVATTVTTAFAAVMSVLTSPVTAVIAAIVALVGVIYLLVENWKVIKEVAINVFNAIVEFYKTIAEWFIKNVINPLFNAFNTMWTNIKDLAQTAWNGITGVFKSAISWFTNSVTKPIAKVFSNLWSGVASAASSAWDKITSIFDSSGKFLTGVTSGIGKIFKSVVNGLIDGINTIIYTPLNTISNALKTIHDIDLPLIGKPFTIIPDGFSVPQIPRLFTGGLAYGDTLARVGDYSGSAINPEVIAPLSDLKSMLLDVVVPNNVGTQQGEQTVVTKVYLNGKEIFEQVDQYKNQQGYDYGYTF